jgi:hypothetical protein
MSVATNNQAQETIAQTAPLHCALALPKVVITVLGYLWGPNLRCPCLVCCLWASVGLPLLCRWTTPSALCSVPNSNSQHQALAAYVRRLNVD